MTPTPTFLLRRRAASFLSVAVAVFGLAGCQQADTSAMKAVEITRDTPCSLDGMTLADFPGPKAQVVYAQGAPDFFCDTIEMFAVTLRPEQKRKVAAIYVQDMARAAWDDPKGHWIDARGAWYVVGSKARGSMGATFASFSTEQDAKAFVAREGGTTYRFDQITPQMATLDGGVLKDHMM